MPVCTADLGTARYYHEQQELGAGEEPGEGIIHQPGRTSSQWPKESCECWTKCLSTDVRILLPCGQLKLVKNIVL